MVSDSNGKRWRNTSDDVLTINLAPLNASFTLQLSKAVLEFSFGKKKLTGVARSGGTASSGTSGGGGQTRPHTAVSGAENSECESNSDPSAMTRSKADQFGLLQRVAPGLKRNFIRSHRKDKRT
jgi:hypothetical protein